MASASIQSSKDLKRLRDSVIKKQKQYKASIYICMTGCRALGALDVASAFRTAITDRSLEKEVAVVETGCIGLCAEAPVVRIEPYNFLYGGVTPDHVDEILETTIKNGQPVLSLCVTENDSPVPRRDDTAFFRHQTRTVLENCGRIDPRSIEDAIGHGAYQSVADVMNTMAPDEVIEAVVSSGLRGRGGAGFPTGVKWRFCRQSPGTEKYLICNADEGDPGAFMDRAILEGDPHRVIEGMLTAAYAIGASQGFVYVRAEYPIAVEHITRAIEQARELGILGENCLGSGFSFDLEVRMGAGAFVCGEETALIASLEGRRGAPRPRPPYPAVSGFHGKPTNINNVETFANIPVIMGGSPERYAGIGTENSPGTKIFALAGKVANTGLVEVPMGATLREIVFEIGGGIPGKRKFKAAQLGGPSGGCIPPQYIDRQLDYDSVEEIGAIMGSGGLIVMDDNTCMVDVARYFLEFVQSESCGKCTPCRIGTRKMLEILENICSGEAKLEDIDQLERLAHHVKKASLCGLGQTAPNPVLSTLRYFRDEYEEHIVLKTCRAAACSALVRAPCQHACPAGVNVPEYMALAWEGRLTEAANVIRRRNPFIAVCGRVCDHPCESRCRRGELDQPLAIRALKRFVADNVPNYSTPLISPLHGPAEVAVIGSGPAGLSCAYFLALMGRRSIIFEEHPVPGGMLAIGIPEYRMPKDVLDREIGFILSHGIELRTGTRITDAAHLLDEGYKAVMVATGAQHGRKLGIPGEDLDAVIDALDVLRDRALDKPVDLQNKTIVIIGGGNAAIDVSRSVLRMAETILAVDTATSALKSGAGTVKILYRRSREEMPAYEEEVDEALSEGVELQCLTIPKRILGTTHVTGIEMLRASLGEADSSGRRRPEPIAGSEFVVECDVVIYAIGQVPSTEPLMGVSAVEFTPWHSIKVDPRTMVSNNPRIFAAGDLVTGGTTVIEAIATGQRAARGIDIALGGMGVLPHDSGFSIIKPDEDRLTHAPPRVSEQTISIRKRMRGFAEVVLGLDKEQALAESTRCLRCDLENY
jgi:NADH-quinone oxidoreductase subunit F